MSQAKLTENKEWIEGMSNIELSSFAHQIHNQATYAEFKERDELTSDQMLELIETCVLQMMDRDLLIPCGGTGINLMEVAHTFHDHPDFGDKYRKI